MMHSHWLEDATQESSSFYGAMGRDRHVVSPIRLTC